MKGDEETWVELLLEEPEIVAWLEPDEHDDEDDDSGAGSR
jgi:hypothetical protein